MFFPLLLALLSPPAHADAEGTAMLERIDATAKVQDAHIVLDVVVHDGKGSTAPRTLEIWQSGTDDRMIRIVDPPRLTGVGLLITHSDTIHLYLPQYPPARRVVSNRRADAFMGTDFAIEDLSNMSWAEGYEATIGTPTRGLTLLNLTPKEGKGTLTMWVDGGHSVRRVDHLDSHGTATRRLTMADVRPVGGVPLAHSVTVEDLSRGRKTVATVREAQIDGGIPSSIFTVSNLEQD